MGAPSPDRTVAWGFKKPNEGVQDFSNRIPHKAGVVAFADVCSQRRNPWCCAAARAHQHGAEEEPCSQAAGEDAILRQPTTHHAGSVHAQSPGLRAFEAPLFSLVSSHDPLHSA